MAQQVRDLLTPNTLTDITPLARVSLLNSEPRCQRGFHISLLNENTMITNSAFTWLGIVGALQEAQLNFNLHTVVLSIWKSNIMQVVT